MSSTATLERQDGPPASKASAAAVPNAPPAEPDVGCPKCGNLDSWGTASWCPKCGYYPRLGTCIGSSESEGEGYIAPSSYLEALARLPRWAYILAAGVLGIIVMSLLIRAITPDDSFARSAWSCLQLLIGGGTFVGVHVYAFIRAGMKSNKVGGFDVIIRPIEVWRPSFQELPATARRVWAGMWGLTAALCAMLVIGGIRYSVLTDDWGFKERPKKNMLKQIKDQMLANAKEEEDADNLEDAIADFAGDDEAMKNKTPKKDADLELLSAECLVIGYNVDRSTGQVNELVLATVVDEKLKYAGVVTGGLAPEVQQQLQERLPKLQQERPFLKSPVTATWVKPTVTCRIGFKSWTGDKRFERPVFKELLAEVK